MNSKSRASTVYSSAVPYYVLSIAVKDAQSLTSSVLCNFRVYATFHGKASHAAAFPWEGVNALDAAVMTYNNVSYMRQQMKPTWRIHGEIHFCNFKIAFCVRVKCWNHLNGSLSS